MNWTYIRRSIYVLCIRGYFSRFFYIILLLGIHSPKHFLGDKTEVACNNQILDSMVICTKNKSHWWQNISSHSYGQNNCCMLFLVTRHSFINRFRAFLSKNCLHTISKKTDISSMLPTSASEHFPILKNCLISRKKQTNSYLNVHESFGWFRCVFVVKARDV